MRIVLCIVACATVSCASNAPVCKGPSRAVEPEADWSASVEEPALSAGEDPPESLMPEHIVPVVAAVRSKLEARCWQPALNARSADAPVQVRVLVDVRVDPSGSVTAAQSRSSPQAYPCLSTCVEALLHRLRFPRAKGRSTVVIPFSVTAGRLTRVCSRRRPR
jgi:hypothetical protein